MGTWIPTSSLNEKGLARHKQFEGADTDLVPSPAMGLCCDLIAQVLCP